MTALAGQRWWLVGASEGLGAALARELSAKGVSLVLSARDAGRLQTVADDLPGPAEVLPLDVTDPLAVLEAGARLGQIDGMVWLAAAYWPMRAQDWDGARAVTMAEVNFTGLLRCLDLVLPQMLARDRGHVVITGSLAAYRGLPGAIGYGASKAACASLAETLACDLRGTGIRVQLAQPGYIRTRLTALNDFAMPQIMTPEAAAAQVLRLIEGRRFARAFPVPFAWLFRLAQFLPEGVYFRLFGGK